MTAKSKLSKGSVFKFNIVTDEVIPLEKLQTVPLKDVIGLTSERVYRILIVDDNKINRLLLKHLLLPVGFETQEAEDGKQAIERWKNWQPHLILMDLQMPIMDGYEATKKIRALSKEVVIFAVTANVFDGTKENALAAGCNYFIGKPFLPDDIFTAIKNFLKVNYIYKDTPSTFNNNIETEDLTKESITKLPLKLQTQLKQAMEIVDIKTIEKLLKIIRQKDPQLANKIQHQLDNFKYETLLDLFE